MSGNTVIALGFVFIAVWLVHGVYLAPSKKEPTRIVDKFVVPAHMEKHSVIIDWYGSSCDSSFAVPPEHYLTIMLRGEEDYLLVNKKTYERIPRGAEGSVEYSLIFGFYPFVRKVHIGGKTIS